MSEDHNNIPLTTGTGAGGTAPGRTLPVSAETGRKIAELAANMRVNYKPLGLATTSTASEIGDLLDAVEKYDRGELTFAPGESIQVDQRYPALWLPPTAGR